MEFWNWAWGSTEAQGWRDVTTGLRYLVIEAVDFVQALCRIWCLGRIMLVSANTTIKYLNNCWLDTTQMGGTKYKTINCY